MGEFDKAARPTTAVSFLAHLIPGQFKFCFAVGALAFRVLCDRGYLVCHWHCLLFYAPVTFQHFRVCRTKATFLSPNEYPRDVTHAWKTSNLSLASSDRASLGVSLVTQISFNADAQEHSGRTAVRH